MSIFVNISLLTLYRKKSMHIFMYPLSNLYVLFKIVFASMLVLSFCYSLYEEKLNIIMVLKSP